MKFTSGPFSRGGLGFEASVPSAIAVAAKPVDAELHSEIGAVIRLAIIDRFFEGDRRAGGAGQGESEGGHHGETKSDFLGAERFHFVPQ